MPPESPDLHDALALPRRAEGESWPDWLIRLRQHQARAWRGGHPLLVEQCLAHFPELSSHADDLLDLIAHERLLRRERGEAPTTEEYERRFPALAADIRLQFEVEEAADGLGEAEADSLSETSILADSPPVGATSRKTPPSVPTLPARFGQLRFLGAGAFGHVWEAWDAVLERRVAVKIPTHTADERGTWEGFVREARAAAKLNDPRICQIYELVEDHDPPFLVLEFVPGPTLGERLRAGGPLPIDEACKLASSIARALHHAHERGVVHRDVKPDNIKLAGDAVKVLDFGLARLLTNRQILSSGQAVRGTPAYLAPEQAGDTRQQVGAASDQFTLGVVLYEMLTGRRPFDAADGGVMETLFNIVHRPAPSPRALREEIDPALAAVVLRALEKRPGDRFPNLAALADALDAYRAGSRSTSSLPSRRRRRLLGGLVLAALLLLAAVVAWRWWPAAVPGTAPEPPRPRARLGPAHVLRAVKRHLEQTDPADRPFKRYLTLTNLHNDPQLTDDDLRQARAAAALVVNGLHWQPRLLRPEPVDAEQTVLAIDLKELGWESDGVDREWDHLIAAYPYGLRYTSAERLGDDTQFLARQVQGLLGRPCVAWLRADWFVCTALQAPHYGRLLHLPETLAELEKKLELDTAANERGERLVRAALRRRVLERHDLPEGRAFWRTFDQPPGAAAAATRPLGPFVLPGQVLFHLADGLPAFVSVDAGGRCQSGPRPTGVACPAAPAPHLEPAALSCVTCHVRGPASWPGGSPRPAGLFEPTVAEKVARLYADEKTLAGRLESDRGLVRRVRADAAGPGAEETDPVAAVALRYLGTPVDAVTAARELDLDDVEELKRLIRATPLLADDWELRPLAEGKTVPRSVWAHPELERSPFREVASKLKLGGGLRAP
jgi:tRNA A-37 threonylcarbamoyl transferase component Bud32